MALTKTARSLIPIGTSCVPSTPQRGRVDLNTVQGGGYLTIKMANGSAPGIQCTCSVMIAHNALMPAAGAAGADWKVIAQYGGGVTASAITEVGLAIDPAIMCLQVEFAGNTTNNVTVEAQFSELTSVG